jgi:hypothetical protein
MALQTLTPNEWAEIWSASPQYGWCLVDPQKAIFHRRLLSPQLALFRKMEQS